MIFCFSCIHSYIHQFIYSEKNLDQNTQIFLALFTKPLKNLDKIPRRFGPFNIALKGYVVNRENTKYFNELFIFLLNHISISFYNWNTPASHIYIHQFICSWKFGMKDISALFTYM